MVKRCQFDWMSEKQGDLHLEKKLKRFCPLNAKIVMFISFFACHGSYAQSASCEKQSIFLACSGETTFEGAKLRDEKIVKITRLPNPERLDGCISWEIDYNGRTFNDYFYLKKIGAAPEDLSGSNKVSVDEFEIFADYRSPNSSELRIRDNLKINRVSGSIFYSARTDGKLYTTFEGVCKKAKKQF